MAAARVTRFGVVAGDFRAEGYRALEGGGGQFSVRGVEVKLGLEGRHQAVNAVAALATGVTAGVTLADGAEALANVAVEHRLQELPAPGGFTIVDDAYNASPESMIAAFEALAESPRRRRLLAVLGQIAEPRALPRDTHRQPRRRPAP